MAIHGIGPQKLFAMAAKFIEPLQVFVAGDTLGYIHVYSYEKEEKLQSFRGHAEHVTLLEVHPSKPLVLSASWDNVIKLWDWKAGWQCIRTFEGHSEDIEQAIRFNPHTAGNTFASCSEDCTIKIWDMYSPSPTPVASFECGSRHARGLDYFSPGGDLQYLVARLYGRAQIWDLQEKKRIKRIKGLQDIGCNIAVVENLSGRPILLTVSDDHTVSFCDSTTHRYENWVNFNLGRVRGCAYINMTKSLAVLCEKGIGLMEID
ncbi:uncharacterized protein [Lolium perenne]|uniref:uncharacterized protein n=1 Tax=Lolium perenne TaxID=4522 RepID=UPI0021F5E96B|nr:coatomer subunit beta'-2-like [Lolium perenne]